MNNFEESKTANDGYKEIYINSDIVKVYSIDNIVFKKKTAKFNKNNKAIITNDRCLNLKEIFLKFPELMIEESYKDEKLYVIKSGHVEIGSNKYKLKDGKYIIKYLKVDNNNDLFNVEYVIICRITKD